MLQITHHIINSNLMCCEKQLPFLHSACLFFPRSAIAPWEIKNKECVIYRQLCVMIKEKKMKVPNNVCHISQPNCLFFRKICCNAIIVFCPMVGHIFYSAFSGRGGVHDLFIYWIFIPALLLYK